MDYYQLIRPLLFLLEPEKAHDLAVWALKHHCVPRSMPFEDERLHQMVWGVQFPNPVGMAAGFDKNAEVVNPLFKQGFGFVEVGTVTPKPQEGNPKPRLFRLVKEQGVINRLGFNNQGIESFLTHYAEKEEGLVGINIGKNKNTEDAIEDYVFLLDKVYGLSTYITLNISSPNTPGLRDMQKQEILHAFLSTMVKERDRLADSHKHKVPLVVKIAPDITKEEQQSIAEVLLDTELDGLIVSNTTIGRDGIAGKYQEMQGGLSGKPLLEFSTAILRNMYKYTKGQIPIIGVGGVASGHDAYTKIQAGASLVQLYSALVFQGFGLVNRINKELVQLMERDGVKSISELVGQA